MFLFFNDTATTEIYTLSLHDALPIWPLRVRRRNLGALPAHLPRVEVLVDIEDKSCPCCGGALHVIGEDASEMLDIDRKSTRLNSSHANISYAVFCLNKTYKHTHSSYM